MTPPSKHPNRVIICLQRFTALIVCALSILSSLGVAHAVTDIAQAPLNFLISSEVKPNIYFILDDSGSMNWSYMGDEVMTYGYEKTVGYRSSRCNKIYYNPAITYQRPVNHDGTLYPAQSFTAALYDGFNDQSEKVDLSKEFMAWKSLIKDWSVPDSTDKIIYRSQCGNGITQCSIVTGDYPNTAGRAYYLVYKGDKAANLGDNSALDA